MPAYLAADKLVLKKNFACTGGQLNINRKFSSKIAAVSGAKRIPSTREHMH